MRTENVKTAVIPENLTPRQKKDLQKLQKLSMEFEAFFMKETVKAMRDTVPQNELINGGQAEEIYRSMYDDQLATSLAEKGNSGIAKAIFKQMSRAYLNTGSMATAGIR